MDKGGGMHFSLPDHHLFLGITAGENDFNLGIEPLQLLQGGDAILCRHGDIKNDQINDLLISSIDINRLLAISRDKNVKTDLFQHLPSRIADHGIVISQQHNP